ncbi:MAG: YceI family protein [Chitinophagaceae bacterium]|nr:YceI family protein [Chitinophagaceae bacterium]
MKYQFALYALLIIASACSRKNENLLSTYIVDESHSVIGWKGAAPDHFHEGSFSLWGKIHGDSNGNIKDGKFSIPIASIKNFDLPDTIKPQLLDHLKGQDFFNIALYPDAGFEIERVTPYDKFSPDTTHIIQGVFTMLGKTNTISFPAKITFENGSIRTQAGFSIDRLKWGMASFSDPNGELYIFPEVEIKLDIKATK